MNQSTSIGFSPPSSGEGDLIIEQGQPGASDGYLSKAGMYMILWNLLEGEEQDEPDCVTDIGMQLFVYRYDLSLPYTLKVTHGSLGEKIVQPDLQFTEKIKFSMSDEATFKYPSFGVVSREWLGGKVWDEDGNPTTDPGITTNKKNIKLSKKVYGTLAVTYRINRDSYSLGLAPREETEENKYSSVAYALHVGGPTWLKLEPPPRVEEIDMKCTGGGGILDLNPDDDDDGPPYAPNVDAETVIDYCSQEVIRESP